MKMTSITGTIAAVVMVATVACGLLYDNSRTGTVQVGSMSTNYPPRTPTPPKLPPLSNAPTISFYGDSLTAESPSAPDGSNFRDIVTRATSATEIVTAQPAIRTGSFANQHVVAPVAELTVVELGTHDVDKTSIPDFTGSYSALIKSIRAANPHGGIMCLGTWTFRQKAGPYDAAIRNICRENEGITVPLSSLYINETNRDTQSTALPSGIADEFHPNATGHQQISRLILRNIQSRRESGS